MDDCGSILGRVRVQTGSAAHPAFSHMGITESFLGDKATGA